MFATIQQYAKAIVTLVGAVLTAGAFTLPDDAQPWVGLALAILTAIGTYVVPNAPTAAQAAAVREADAKRIGEVSPPQLEQDV
jgi:putative Mn2+ efflux pump MntP